MSSLEDLKAQLVELHLRTDKELTEKFGRSLPFQDGFFDRWERAKRLNFGEKASIYNSALVFGDVLVGRETWIGPYVILDGSAGKLRIGSYCSISAGVQIYTHDTVMWALSGGKQKTNKQSVTIGDCCYIGAQSVIKAGVHIGSHCVIGANSFVNKSVEDNQIVGGTPAKVIGRVIIDGDQIRLVYK